MVAVAAIFAKIVLCTYFFSSAGITGMAPFRGAEVSDPIAPENVIKI